jgi:hypothetical protein
MTPLGPDGRRGGARARARRSARRSARPSRASRDGGSSGNGPSSGPARDSRATRRDPRRRRFVGRRLLWPRTTRQGCRRRAAERTNMRRAGRSGPYIGRSPSTRASSSASTRSDGAWGLPREAIASEVMDQLHTRSLTTPSGARQEREEHRGIEAGALLPPRVCSRRVTTNGDVPVTLPPRRGHHEPRRRGEHPTSILLARPAEYLDRCPLSSPASFRAALRRKNV